MPLPAWVACKVTLPAPVRVTVSPETVAGPLVTASVTGRPELAVGVTVNGPSHKPWSGTGAKVMVCGVITGMHAVTAKLCAKLGADAKVELPAWDAVNTTVPVRPVSVTKLFPEIVAGPLVTTSVTGRLELAVGVTVKAASHAV